MIYIDADGDRYETSDATADPVKFWPQGGGLGLSMPRLKFHARFQPAPEPTWRAGTVTADWLPGKTYPCWSNGEVWNGWGMPYFTCDVINTLVADLKEAGMQTKVEWVGDHTIRLMYTDPDEDETYEIVPISVPGCLEPLYGLGAGNWTWDAIEFNKET